MQKSHHKWSQWKGDCEESMLKEKKEEKAELFYKN